MYLFNLELIALLEKDDKTILSGSDSNGNRYLGEMLRLYEKTFSTPCGSCPKKFPVYLQQLRKLVMKEKQTVSKFELKAGVTIPIFGTSESYSDHNLTDEAALKILSRNKNAIAVFKAFPKDWEEQADAYGSGETTVNNIEQLGKLTVKAIQTLFPDVEGKTKKELIDNISEKYPELVKKENE